MKILFCGDREWSNTRFVAITFTQLLKKHGKFMVIHGAARGADSCADTVGNIMKLSVRPVRAEWLRYGRAAGPIRNRRMLDENPDLVVAFHDDIIHSTGTKDCIKQAQSRGIKVRLFTRKGEIPVPLL